MGPYWGTYFLMIYLCVCKTDSDFTECPDLNVPYYQQQREISGTLRAFHIEHEISTRISKFKGHLTESSAFSFLGLINSQCLIRS